jgi:hypothetical protein
MTVPTLTPRPQDHDNRPVMPFRRRTPSCPALRVSVLTKQYPVPRTSIDCGMNFYGLHYIVSSGLLSRWHCDKKDRRFFVHEIKFPRRFLWVMHKAASYEHSGGGIASASPSPPVIHALFAALRRRIIPLPQRRPEALRCGLSTPARSSPGSPASATASGRCSGRLWGSRTSPPPGTGRSSCAVR